MITLTGAQVARISARLDSMEAGADIRTKNKIRQIKLELAKAGRREQRRKDAGAAGL